MTARLLVLDFDGVCTYNHREIVSHPIDVTKLENLIRPGVSDLVTAAQDAGVIVAILSNDLPSSWIGELDILKQVDHVFLGSDNGIYKPDRRAFQRCLVVTGVSPECTVVVDDHVDNVNVAATLGMTAFLFDDDFVWAPVREALGV
ncbi:MAG: HAD-IA family hydrolase [Acidimicrobiales bacterium]